MWSTGPDTTDPAILINGLPSDQVFALDRGLNYGDGVFRTMRVCEHTPVAWSAQMQRLAHDCRRLGLPMPAAEFLYDETRRLFSGRADGVLKILVTRGSGGRGYAPPEAVEPLRILSAHQAPPPLETLELAESSIRLPRQPALAGIKHLNRLEQVLARRECVDHGWVDALMRDTSGYVICTTMRNLLLVIDGQWVTPALDQAGVAGATRARLMAGLARAGQPVTESCLTLSDCYAAQAILACNSVSGITPVVRLASHQLPDSADRAAYCRDVLKTANAQG